MLGKMLDAENSVLNRENLCSDRAHSGALFGGEDRKVSNFAVQSGK